jgi:hypothetical protein
MGKYEPLSRYLASVQEDSWDASFGEIERILGFDLPASAHEHRAWWANNRRGNHSQTNGWLSAGWETREVDQSSKRVRFERRRHPSGSAKPLRDLWRQAAELSGIEDREELERRAVSTFIHLEAGRQLAAMGGTMPDLKVPPRERPNW